MCRVGARRHLASQRLGSGKHLLEFCVLGASLSPGLAFLLAPLTAHGASRAFSSSLPGKVTSLFQISQRQLLTPQLPPSQVTRFHGLKGASEVKLPDSEWPLVPSWNRELRGAHREGRGRREILHIRKIGLTFCCWFKTLIQSNCPPVGADFLCDSNRSFVPRSVCSYRRALPDTALHEALESSEVSE